MPVITYLDCKECKIELSQPSHSTLSCEAVQTETTYKVNETQTVTVEHEVCDEDGANCEIKSEESEQVVEVEKSNITETTVCSLTCNTGYSFRLFICFVS